MRRFFRAASSLGVACSVAVVVACSVALVGACGARTPLERATASSDGGAIDAAAVCTRDAGVNRAPCTSWRVVGDEQIVGPSPGVGAGLGVQQPVASGCGVLVAWYTATGRDASTVAWFTRSIGFDGAPRAGIADHPALSTTTSGSGAMSLAASGAGAAALVSNGAGCALLPLTSDGADDGALARQGDFGCGTLAADGPGYSYMSAAPRGATPPTLHRVDARGAPRSASPLAVPSGRALWDRLVFDDGSFLLYTFREDPATARYTDWLQRFGADGAPLAPESVVVNANTAPVLLAPTPRGAMAAWTWSAVNVVSVDRNGAENGLVQTIAVAAPLYGAALVPVPSGDVLVLWWTDGTGRYDLYGQATTPDGLPRGAPTLLKSQARAGRFYAVADPSGDRAVLVYGDDGVKAQALECVR